MAVYQLALGRAPPHNGVVHHIDGLRNVKSRSAIGPQFQDKLAPNWTGGRLLLTANFKVT